MDDEVTRTSSADRDRYVDHLPALHAAGYISQEQVDTMSGRMLQADTMRELDEILAGFPKPSQPRRPRDWGIPGNFLPACAIASLAGVTIAVVPTAALAGRHGAVAGVVTGLALCWGIWIVIIAVIAAITGGFSWDSLGSAEKLERKKRDQQGR